MSATSITSNTSTSQTTKPSQSPAPTILGIYGVSGCGKSCLAKQLKAQLPDSFVFYEGSDELAKRVPGGLEAFKQMGKDAQDLVRDETIEGIRDDCTISGKTGIITGHYMFWNANTLPSDANAQVAMTEVDKKIYTHILYLMTDPETVVQQVAQDATRKRHHFDAATIHEWQTQEEQQLRSICQNNDILFATIRPDFLPQAIKYVQSTTHHNESTNESRINQALDRLIETLPVGDVKTMLVLDADGTLAPQDASKLYWSKARVENPLKTLFQSHLAYSHTAFCKKSWLYEEHADSDKSDGFDRLCEEAASAITVHPEMHSLLQRACADKTVGVVIVSCGLSHAWGKVLEKLNLSRKVPVIGNGRLSEYVVTPKTKRDIVARLKDHHKFFVCAIGDSQVDVPMMKKADQAVVVVGPEEGRSKKIEPLLQDAIDKEGLRARQALLPEGSTPRLDTSELPTVKLDDAFFTALTRDHSLKIYDVTNKPATKLLTSSTRNSAVKGLDLQRAHENAGWYLATEYISLALGVKTFDIISVQGQTTQAHRLFDEQKTCIVPLMRGGDPIGRGVHKAFPAAMYHFAKDQTDIEPKHVAGKNTIILADWVINTGKGMVEFVKHIRENLSSQIRIVLVAGVVQEEAVEENRTDGVLQKELAGMGEVTLVALRISQNK